MDALSFNPETTTQNVTIELTDANEYDDLARYSLDVNSTTIAGLSKGDDIPAYFTETDSSYEYHVKTVGWHFEAGTASLDGTAYKSSINFIFVTRT